MALARFGTDGVRGVANADLTAELALALGRAAARVLATPEFVVGRDPRRSGPMLQAAFSAGLVAEGVDVLDVGMLPTPGVARLAERRQAPAAVVSASHNPFSDNGIKLFGPGGTKLDLETEQAVEARLHDLLSATELPTGGLTGERVGRIRPDPTAEESYVAELAACLDGRRLDGLRVLLDCANGAASEVGPRVFAALGAEVRSICHEPDGRNINDGCGSTHPERLVHEVVASGVDLGLAFDGDADRLLAVDHLGVLADGDLLLALFALDRIERGSLPKDTVVVTVMTNLGFRLAMARHGIAVRETPVGDRHVLAELEREGLTLGGEQSGHIVFRDRATTGDGILTALTLCDLVRRRGRPLAELREGLIEPVPQVLLNVAVADPSQLAEADAVWKAVAWVEEELGQSGRVLLRPSGTEPLVRVMVEATSAEQADGAARRLVGVVEASLAPPNPDGAGRGR